jgi:formyl-CoA transferase
MTDKRRNELPLRGIRVIDASSLFAGPGIAALLGDFGADVIKIEHPSGDAIRKLGLLKDGVSLAFKLFNRNKRCITLNIKHPKGQEVFRRLVREADVIIENFRTGTLEAWGVGWDSLSSINPGLVMVRVTGFGQTGPYRYRPGFGTLAEAMSGFAHITGEPAGPPTLPPFGHADAVSAICGAYATMLALYERDAKGSGKGQYIDLAIYAQLFAILGYQATAYDQLGIIQQRTGNRTPDAAPRNVYETSDGRWVALSAAAPSIVERVLRLTGGEQVVKDPRFKTTEGRLAHVEEIDGIVGGWIGKHTLQEVIEAFEAAQAAIAPIYDISQIFEDPQYEARQDIVSVPDSELGKVKMQNVSIRLSRTPGRIKHAGPRLGEHNEEIYVTMLGMSESQMEALREEKVI